MAPSSVASWRWASAAGDTSVSTIGDAGFAGLIGRSRSRRFYRGAADGPLVVVLGHAVVRPGVVDRVGHRVRVVGEAGDAVVLALGGVSDGVGEADLVAHAGERVAVQVRVRAERVGGQVVGERAEPAPARGASG